MITAKYVRERVSYDPDTGVLVWKKRPSDQFSSERLCNSWNARFSGKPASSVKPGPHTNYIRICIDYKHYRGHRIAWLIHTGEWPKYDIDHIDGDGLNNKFVNLRDVTRKDNMKNTCVDRRNTSGVMGVVWDNRRNKWNAHIGNDYKKAHLGNTDDFFEAVCLRKTAENKLGFHENHGRKPNAI